MREVEGIVGEDELFVAVIFGGGGGGGGAAAFIIFEQEPLASSSRGGGARRRQVHPCPPVSVFGRRDHAAARAVEGADAADGDVLRGDDEALGLDVSSDGRDGDEEGGDLLCKVGGRVSLLLL